MALNINRDINLKSEPIDAAPKQDRRTWWMTLFLLCALLGAMLGLSVRTQTVKQQQDKIAQMQGSEVLIRANADLQRRVAQLQKDNTQLAVSAPSDTARLKLLSKDLANAQFLAGLTDVKGPGVIVTMDDSKLPYPKDSPPGVPPINIIHDTDIGQVVNELKAAGAEAISVNDQRLVAVSPIRCAGPTIFINNTPQTPPYVIKAIGDPKILMTAINLPGGMATIFKGFDPAMFKIEKAAKPLTIPAYAGGIEPKYARPAGQQVASAAKKPGE
jgi:uncharacterized protein YlxW (UPF0749 family)